MKSITVGNLIVVGNVNVAASGQVVILGNVIATGGNIGNVRLDGDNVSASGQVNVLGNVVATNFIGNGSLLTGIAGTTSIINGNSNVVIVNNGNITMGISGVSNVFSLSGNGLTISGNLYTSSGLVYNVPASYARYVRTATQTMAASGNLIFTTAESSFGTDITANTTTGIFTLAAGKTYRVRGSPGYFVSGSTTNCSWRWYNATAGNYIGSSAQIDSWNTVGGSASIGGTAEATITPTVATNIVLSTSSGAGWTAGVVSGSTTQAALLPWADIEVLTTTAPLTVIPQIANTLSVTGNITGSNIVLTGGQLYQPIRYAQYKGIGTQVINTNNVANVQFEKGLVESFGNVGLAVSNTGNTTFTNVSGGPMLLQINAIIPTQVGTYGTWGTTAYVNLKRVSGGNTTVVSCAAMTNTVTNFYNKMDYAIATPLYLPNNGDVFYFNMYVESTTGGSMTITDTNTVGNSTLNITRLI
jgi:hypothetical protein